MKNFVFSLVVIWLLMPTTAFAINPYYTHKIESIGEIFRHIFFRHIFTLTIIGDTVVFSIFALIIGYFVHRKYIAYLFFIIYPIIFLYLIFTNSDKKLSDILQGNIFNLYIAVLVTIIAFFASTLFNKIKKGKQNFSNKDYIPLAIIIAITLSLMFLPIRSGHLVCKTPFIKRSFNCNYYLQADQKLNMSWFTF